MVCTVELISFFLTFRMKYCSNKTCFLRPFSRNALVRIAVFVTVTSHFIVFCGLLYVFFHTDDIRSKPLLWTSMAVATLLAGIQVARLWYQPKQRQTQRYTSPAFEQLSLDQEVAPWELS